MAYNHDGRREAEHPDGWFSRFEKMKDNYRMFVNLSEGDFAHRPINYLASGASAYFEEYITPLLQGNPDFYIHDMQ